MNKYLHAPIADYVVEMNKLEIAMMNNTSMDWTKKDKDEEHVIFYLLASPNLFHLFNSYIVIKSLLKDNIIDSFVALKNSNGDNILHYLESRISNTKDAKYTHNIRYILSLLLENKQIIQLLYQPNNYNICPSLTILCNLPDTWFS